MRKRVISGLILATLVSLSVLQAFVYYTTGGSVWEAVGGLLTEVLLTGFFLAFLLLHRLYRTRFTRFMQFFPLGLLAAGCTALFVIGARLNLPILPFLANSSLTGAMAAAFIEDLLPERKGK